MTKTITIKTIQKITLIAVAAASLNAATIVGVGANAGTSFRIGGTASQVETMSWTQTATITNASIAALVGSLDGNSDAVKAYLTTSIGPGAAAPIATATFTVPAVANDSAITLDTIFSGLTLGPGSYYLTLFNSDASGTTNVRWEEAPLTYTNASANGEFFSNTTNGVPNTTNPWQSTFVASTSPSLGFQVTGTVTPEPASLGMAAAGLFAALAFGIRRRK